MKKLCFVQNLPKGKKRLIWRDELRVLHHIDYEDKEVWKALHILETREGYKNIGLYKVYGSKVVEEV